ncbi:uncharacterized protein A4U43_C07F27700 [Asparagus officinalis]|uniref:PWI domain-containing protein n=1 Tax=Asparagus officinalis TaxID=4686 RepID=A0A5P1EFH1_ASPOF|nr:uncharacterized protein A4U43_C07F27700 [Asparagus officinalis]
MDVIRPWIATRVTELLGFEDDVLINFIYGLLERHEVDGKKIQIQLTGFMEKNTGKFMKELWGLLLSTKNNVSGVSQQFLDAKEEETKRKMRKQIELLRTFRRGEIGTEGSLNERERADLMVKLMAQSSRSFLDQGILMDNQKQIEKSTGAMLRKQRMDVAYQFQRRLAAVERDIQALLTLRSKNLVAMATENAWSILKEHEQLLAETMANET